MVRVLDRVFYNNQFLKIVEIIPLKAGMYGNPVSSILEEELSEAVIVHLSDGSSLSGEQFKNECLY